MELSQMRVLPDRDPGALDHVPPEPPVALLGYVSGERDVTRLVQGRHQPEIGAEMLRVGEPVHVAYG